MAFPQQLKDRAKAFIAPLVFLGIAVFFGWSAMQGQHGLLAYSQRDALLKQAVADKAAVQQDHDDWARRVYGLQSRHLDLDTLDERARAQLNLADPNDVIVPFTGKDRVF
ncbi:MAG TPA: septum formation initiator family protein [Acetobacteraceae bacterium]|jgi:cell division protein FtsB